MARNENRETEPERERDEEPIERRDPERADAEVFAPLRAEMDAEVFAAANPPVLQTYGPNVTPAQAAAAAAAEHAMMAVRAVSNLVTMNSTPG